MDSYVAFAGSYDELTTDVPYGAFADFYEDIFKVNGLKPNSLIDLACGTGTLTEIMAGRGYDMTAVDSSPDMLAVAADKLSGLDNRPLLLCQRLEELDLYGTIDVCLCCLDSVNYVTDPALLQRAFDRVHLFLEPKTGLFVFDINTPEKFARIDGNSYVREDDDVFCVWQAAVEDDLCAYQFDIFERDGDAWDRAQETHEERNYTIETLTAMLEKAGFAEIKTYGDQSFAPVRGGEDRIYFTARKRD